MGILNRLRCLSQYRPPGGRRNASALLLVGLLIAGYLGNYFSVTLFFGLDFLFGSIFTLLVLQWFGWRWAIAATAIASVQTYFLWGHPFAAIIFTLETGVVGWGLKRKRFQHNLVLLDTLFWLVVAAPLVWVLYRTNVTQSNIATLVVLLKQALNGICNALIASTLYTLLPLPAGPSLTRKKRLRQILFNLLLAFLFFPPLILTLIDGQQTFYSLQQEIQRTLTATDRSLQIGLHTWHQDHLRTLSALEQQLDQLPTLGDRTAQRLVDEAQQSMADVQSIILVDSSGAIALQSSSSNAFPPPFPANTAYPAQWWTWPQHHRVSLTPLNLHQSQTTQWLSPDLIFPLMRNGTHRGWIVGHLNTVSLDRLFSNYVPDKFIKVMLLDQNQRIVAGNVGDQQLLGSAPDLRAGLEITGVDGTQQYQWFPKDLNVPALQRWQQSSYGLTQGVGHGIPWTLVIRITAAPYMEQLQWVYIKNIGLILGLSGLGLIAAQWVSQRMTRQILALAIATSHLTQRLDRPAPMGDWRSSGIDELDLLTRNFRTMARVLRERFQDIQQMNATLESRVKHRTQALATINQQLSQEVQQRQRIEAQLREREERYELAVSGTHDGIWDWNLATDDVYFSPSWCRLLGYEPDELPHRLETWRDRVHPDDLQTALDAIHHCLAGETALYENVHRLHHRDHHYIWTAAKGKCVFDQDGNPVRLVGTITDITTRKQREEALEQAKAAAEQASRTKSQFLANMSHEIRTPMNAILGFSELLYTNNPDPQNRHYLESIMSSGHVLLTLINDILDLSRIEAGKLQLRYESIPVRQLIQDMYRIFQGQAQGKGLQLLIDIDPQVPDEIWFDGTRLRQILLNVLGNALKFTEEGQVSLSVRAIAPVSLLPPSTQRLPQGTDGNPNTIELEITIADTGIGISPEAREKIFQMFEQTDPQDTRRYGGAGLGLAITKRLTELLGGTLVLESTLHYGSTFTFRFPGIRSTPANLPPVLPQDSTPIQHMQTAQILVVDNSASDRARIESHCFGTPHRVIHATNGPQAIALARRYQPSLILMDLPVAADTAADTVPDEQVMDGQNTAKLLNQDPTTQSIPIVFCSTASISKVPASLGAIGAAFIPKPINHQSLFQVIAEVLTPDSAGDRAPLSALPPTPIHGFPPVSCDPDRVDELLHHLRDSLRIQQQLQKTLKQREIRQFGETLHALGTDFACPLLVDYAHQLLDQLDLFQWDQIPNTIERFTTIHQSLTDSLSD